MQLCHQQSDDKIQSSCTYTLTVMQYNNENSNTHCVMIDQFKDIDELDHDVRRRG